MIKKSIFQASFEESLNLEDLGSVQYQKKDVFDKLEPYYQTNKGRRKLRTQSIILTFIFPGLLNLIITVISLYIHRLGPEETTLPINSFPLLTLEVYGVCLILWIFLVMLGKLVHQTYLFPYRYHLHILTCLIWLIFEFNLLFTDFFLPTIGIFGVLAGGAILVSIYCFLLRMEIINLRKQLYQISFEKGKGTNKIFDLGKYILIFLGGGLIVKMLLSSTISNWPIMIQAVGILLMWVFFNLMAFAFIVFAEFPNYLSAYYKWKYPEDYREWEGKTKEEWYGRKYLEKKLKRGRKD